MPRDVLNSFSSSVDGTNMAALFFVLAVLAVSAPLKSSGKLKITLIER